MWVCAGGADKAARRAGNEDRAEGALGGKVVWAYVAAAGGVAWVLGLVFAYICEQGAKTFTDYWVILWTSARFGDRGLAFYIGLYALIAVGFSVITYARSLFFAFGTVRSLAFPSVCEALLQRE